jgi:hypothetical protein
VRIDARGVQQIHVDGDRSLVVEIGLGDGTFVSKLPPRKNKSTLAATPRSIIPVNEALSTLSGSISTANNFLLFACASSICCLIFMFDWEIISMVFRSLVPHPLYHHFHEQKQLG